MKKLLTVMLAAIMLLAMVACGNNNSEPTPEPTPTPDETKTLYMATEGTFPPYEYYDGDKLVGIDVEVAGAIAEKLGMKLEVVDIAFDSIVSGVQAGKYDMGMAGMTVNEERLEQVNFSDSYSTGIQVVIVKEGGKVQSLDDMGAEGVIIGTQSGTTGFSGGLLYGVLNGWEPEKCLQFGWASGVLAASSLNDYAEPADEKQVWDIYKGNARVQR